MASYGTIMIGKLAAGASESDWQRGIQEWKTERKAAGFIDEYVLASDDGKTIVSCVVFESKDAYLALANDPEQDKWYQAKVAPMLDGDPQWIDGTWPDQPD